MSDRYPKLVNYPYANIVARSLDLPAEVCHENLQRVLHLLKQDLEQMDSSVREYQESINEGAVDSALKQMIFDHRKVERLYRRACRRLKQLQG